ncbi:MAG TPA: hypothetical protein VH044_07000 [Polyangiaceae bacterium]|jgi:hypothetical protein|nr:hypothetical protein [Polyangiaceae bacterium]
MARPSRPPRRRKSRKPEAPQHDVAVVIPPADNPVEGRMHDTTPPPPTVPDDELAELDAGWD